MTASLAYSMARSASVRAATTVAGAVPFCGTEATSCHVAGALSCGRRAVTWPARGYTEPSPDGLLALTTMVVKRFGLEGPEGSGASTRGSTPAPG
ncbi:MAG: hypothetical protein ACLQRH_27120 [Acidimicrobiales bacterium]